MKTYARILILAALAFLINSCKEEPGMIMTVTGPVDPSAMGTTLPHEHFLVDFVGADSTGYHRWNKDTVIAKVLPFLIEAKEAGVQTIIECTPAYLGRDPELLKRLAEQSGLQILTNTGYYGAVDTKALPPEAFTMSDVEMAQVWIAEWQNGIEATGIKPGFIKIAVQGDSGLTEVHRNLVKAAARTHLATGLTINAHTGPDHLALEEIKLIKEEGADPSAFVWTHAQSGTKETHVRLAREGCWISLDNVMEDNFNQYVDFLVNMKENDVLHRALISHDAGWYDVIDPASVTYRGYTALFTRLKPALREKGFTEAEWTMLTVDNPREAYTIKVRKFEASLR